MVMIQLRAGGGAEDVLRPDSASSVEALYRLHHAPLFGFLVRLTNGDHREAEDLLQETFVRAWRFMRDNAADVERLRPWLFTVAKRIAIDAARAKRTRPSVTPESLLATVASPHDDVDRAVTALTVKRAMMTLTPNHQRVLIEVYFRGHSPQETAELLGIPLGTVRSRTFYAMRALAAAIGRAPDRA